MFAGFFLFRSSIRWPIIGLGSSCKLFFFRSILFVLC